MEPLNEFTIPIEGLREGIHEFDFQIDNSFFAQFEESMIKKGSFAVKLYFDKRPDMLVLTFDISGSFQTECDRCLVAIDLPIKESQQLLVKYADQASEQDEVVYISRETKLINVAKFTYEFICLSVPMVKVYDCEAEEAPPCNDEILSFLEIEEQETPAAEEEKDNPIWDALKDLKKKD